VSPPTDSTTPLDYKEALWLATVGGAESRGVGAGVGQLKQGFLFDALAVSGGGMSKKGRGEGRVQSSSSSSSSFSSSSSSSSSFSSSSSWQDTCGVSFSSSRVDVFPTDKITDLVQKVIRRKLSLWAV
jgi:hypothetical protein